MLDGGEALNACGEELRELLEESTARPSAAKALLICLV